MRIFFTLLAIFLLQFSRAQSSEETGLFDGFDKETIWLPLNESSEERKRFDSRQSSEGNGQIQTSSISEENKPGFSKQPADKSSEEKPSDSSSFKEKKDDFLSQFNEADLMKLVRLKQSNQSSSKSSEERKFNVLSQNDENKSSQTIETISDESHRNLERILSKEDVSSVDIVEKKQKTQQSQESRSATSAFNEFPANLTIVLRNSTAKFEERENKSSKAFKESTEKAAVRSSESFEKATEKPRHSKVSTESAEGSKEQSLTEKSTKISEESKEKHKETRSDESTEELNAEKSTEKSAKRSVIAEAAEERKKDESMEVTTSNEAIEKSIFNNSLENTNGSIGKPRARFAVAEEVKEGSSKKTGASNESTEVTTSNEAAEKPISNESTESKNSSNESIEKPPARFVVAEEVTEGSSKKTGASNESTEKPISDHSTQKSVKAKTEVNKGKSVKKTIKSNESTEKTVAEVNKKELAVNVVETSTKESIEKSTEKTESAGFVEIAVQGFLERPTEPKGKQEEIGASLGENPASSQPSTPHHLIFKIGNRYKALPLLADFDASSTLTSNFVLTATTSAIEAPDSATTEPTTTTSLPIDDLVQKNNQNESVTWAKIEFGLVNLPEITAIVEQAKSLNKKSQENVGLAVDIGKIHPEIETIETRIEGSFDSERITITTESPAELLDKIAGDQETTPIATTSGFDLLTSTLLEQIIAISAKPNDSDHLKTTTGSEREKIIEIDTTTTFEKAELSKMTLRAITDDDFIVKTAIFEEISSKITPSDVKTAKSTLITEPERFVDQSTSTNHPIRFYNFAESANQNVEHIDSKNFKKRIIPDLKEFEVLNSSKSIEKSTTIEDLLNPFKPLLTKWDKAAKEVLKADEKKFEPTTSTLGIDLTRTYSHVLQQKPQPTRFVEGRSFYKWFHEDSKTFKIESTTISESTKTTTTTALIPENRFREIKPNLVGEQESSGSSTESESISAPKMFEMSTTSEPERFMTEVDEVERTAETAVFTTKISNDEVTSALPSEKVQPEAMIESFSQPESHENFQDEKFIENEAGKRFHEDYWKKTIENPIDFAKIRKIDEDFMARDGSASNKVENLGSGVQKNPAKHEISSSLGDDSNAEIEEKKIERKAAFGEFLRAPEQFQEAPVDEVEKSKEKLKEKLEKYRLASKKVQEDSEIDESEEPIVEEVKEQLVLGENSRNRSKDHHKRRHFHVNVIDITDESPTKRSYSNRFRHVNLIVLQRLLLRL